jgi:formylglycine-generating enzyme required for sulfatase activity
LGVQRVQENLIERATESAQGLDFEMAENWLDQAAGIRQDQSLVDEARSQLADFENMRGADLESAVLTALEAGDFNLAEFTIIDLIALGGQENRVQVLRTRLEEARFYGGPEPGQSVADEFLNSNNSAPKFVVISAGSFRMGSNKGSDNEKPRHRVTIDRGFGFGVNEVTVAEFRLFMENTSYVTAAENKGSSMVYDESAGRLASRAGIDWEFTYNGELAKPDMPVLHVSWHDAKAYVAWLSKETGKRYRLPSEAEYEYVARDGGSGMYWWGEGSPSEAVENLTGDRDTSPSDRGWSTSFRRYGDGHWGPAETGVLQSDLLIHSMGVNDIAGNVSEWVEDCFHQNYMQAPSDGSAWVNRGCARRVARGGYWASSPERSRAAFRITAKPDTAGPVVGIRIVRDL